MAVKIRLARAGTTHRPFYRIVAASSRSPRDGEFLEKLGTYNPLVAKDHPERLKMNEERIKHWLSVGAQPTDRVARFLFKAGVLKDKPKFMDNAPKPSKKDAKAAA